MAPRLTTQAMRLKRTETEEERLARFAGLRDSSDPHDAEQAMRLAERLVERYMPLVGAALRKWRAEMPYGMRSIGFDDLKAAGMAGLWEALLYYDPAYGLTFASYATPRIRWKMSAEVHGADMLGRDARRTVQRSWRAVKDLEERLNREATEDESAQASGVSVERYRKLRSWNHRSLTAELTDPLARYLTGTDGDPLERLCAIEEALEALEGDDQGIREAAEEIGVAVESVKGYFEMDEIENLEGAA